MHIPTHWQRASGTARAVDGRELACDAWGWGDDDASARARAEERMLRALDRLRAGAFQRAAPRDYGYGDRPLREELVQVPARDASGAPSAAITRNRMGALVLNAARLLFLDIDVASPQGSLAERLRSWLRKAPRRDPMSAEQERLAKALTQAAPRVSFRVYRTAGGFRVLALDRAFDPASEETAALMRATGTDPAFAKLCRAQQSFRARLTPKPWRIRVAAPPGQFPREPREQAEFEAWREKYEIQGARFAVCRAVETVGTGATSAELAPLISLHDRWTRATEVLPLA
jgi:hypothetical protein